MYSRRYRYVGPADIRQRAKRESHCIQVVTLADLLSWTAALLPPKRVVGGVTATFIIDVAERLWVADQRSEHVACADGGDVLAAGEMIFERAAERLCVCEVTNQSTGYRPEPTSWSVVTRVLTRLGIAHPAYFTTAFEFRRCTSCGTTNLIKDDLSECAVCNAPLSLAWNN